MKFAALVNGCLNIATIIASYISYDNSSGDLAATNVQDALDELAAEDDALDGGLANSVYRPEDCFDGGGA